MAFFVLILFIATCFLIKSLVSTVTLSFHPSGSVQGCYLEHTWIDCFLNFQHGTTQEVQFTGYIILPQLGVSRLKNCVITPARLKRSNPESCFHGTSVNQGFYRTPINGYKESVRQCPFVFMAQTMTCYSKIRDLEPVGLVHRRRGQVDLYGPCTPLSRF